MPTRNPYGQYGRLQDYISPAGSGRYQTAAGWTPQSSGLPSYLQNQFYQTNTNSGGDGGTDSTVWNRNQNTLDRNGRHVIQVGDPNGWGDRAHDWVRDPSQVTYDEDLGYVTDPHNLHDTFYDQSAGRRAAPFIAAFLAAGGGLAALGAGGAGAGLGGGEALAGGTGAFDSGIGLDAMAGGPWAGGEGLAAGGTGAFDEGIGLDTMGGGPNPLAGAGADASGGMGRPSLSTLSRGGSILSRLLGGGQQSGTNTGGSSNNSGGNGLSGLWDLISGVGLGALGRNMGNNTQGQFRNDINNMLSIGTGGVTNDDRAGARNLIRGVYDGSIDPSTVLDRVPGLRAQSERGASDINRRFSAQGENAPNDPHATREWVGYNNDLVRNAYGSEMDRAARIGGYNIDPSQMAGRGLQALSQFNQNQQGLDQGTMGLLQRLLGGGGGSGGTNSIFQALSRMFGGGDNNDGVETTDPTDGSDITSGGTDTDITDLSPWGAGAGP